MNHPASQYTYEDLKSLLNNAVDRDVVNRKEWEHYSLYDYNPYAIYDHGWDEASKMSRGLVLDNKNNRVAAYAFPKFFNYGEVPLHQIPADRSFRVYDKLDGSLGIAFYHEDGDYWKVNTRGSFNSEQSIWAEVWLNSQPEEMLQSLVRGHTYLFEIIYARNKIVIDYQYEGLVLLSAYDEFGLEYSRRQLESLPFDIVNEESYASIEELLERSKSIPANKEGWVLHWESGYRIKIKGDEYCRIHKLISSLSPLAVWESFVNLDNIELLRQELPEEFRADLDDILGLISGMYDAKLEQTKEWIRWADGKENREIGLALSAGEIEKEASVWMFIDRKLEDRSLDVELATNADLRKKFCASFRPTGNVLAGYVPRSSMNRFVDNVNDTDNEV